MSLKCKKTEIISSIFSHHNGIRLDSQLQEENCEKHKDLKAKQHATKHASSGPWITEEIKEEITKYLETNENRNKTFQNLWDSAKADLRGKFIAIEAYIRKQEKSQINNLTHLQELEKEEQSPKLVEEKEIIETKVVINERD